MPHSRGRTARILQSPVAPARRPSASFSLVEVLLALSILSIGLTTLLIARNRSIVRLRTTLRETQLRTAAEAAISARMLALMRPDAQLEAPESPSGNTIVTAETSSEEFGDGVVLHRVSVTAKYGNRSDAVSFALAGAALEIRETQDETGAERLHAP